MKIQLISPSKLKILFNIQDLEENNITVHSFLSGSEISKNFLNAIIEIAEEDFGIKKFENNYSYEAICFNYTEFIIIISLDKDIFHTPDTKNIYFYFFDMDSFFEFSNYLKKTINFNIKSFLYEYKNIFLLEINFENLSSQNIKNLNLIFSETTNRFNFKNYNHSITRFKEFSNLLISDNAINF